MGITITWPASGQDAPPISATKLSPALVLLSGTAAYTGLLRRKTP